MNWVDTYGQVIARVSAPELVNNGYILPPKVKVIDMAKVDKIMARERFSIPKGTHFKDLYAKREESNIGEIIQTALKKIEESNI